MHDAPFACIFQGVVGLPGPAGPIGHPGPPVRTDVKVSICAFVSAGKCIFAFDFTFTAHQQYWITSQLLNTP